jgi:hypothetical protein
MSSSSATAVIESTTPVSPMTAYLMPAVRIPPEERPVDDVEPHLHGDTRQHREGNVTGQSTCPEHHDHQDQGPRQAGK